MLSKIPAFPRGVKRWFELITLFAPGLLSLPCAAEQWVSLAEFPNSNIQIDQDALEVQPDGQIKAVWMDQWSSSNAIEYSSVMNCQEFSARNIQRTTINTVWPIGHPLRRERPWIFRNPLNSHAFGSAFDFPLWTSKSGLVIRSVCGQASQIIPIATGSLSPCPPGLGPEIGTFVCSKNPGVAANFGVFTKRIDQVETACKIPKEDIQYATFTELQKVGTCPGDACAQLIFGSAVRMLTADLESAAEGKQCTEISARIESERQAADTQALLRGIATEYVRCARDAVAYLDDNVSQPSEIAIATNERCRKTLSNDRLDKKLLVTLEQQFIKTNISMVLERRAAKRQDGQNQQQKPKRPVPLT